MLVAGGGLAGLTLARQLRQTHPELSVLVVEKTKRPLPAAAHKVGESSVELGSQYLERLGLRDYLHKNPSDQVRLALFFLAAARGRSPSAARSGPAPSRW